MTTKAFMSPVGGGWYDGPDDPGRDYVGCDIAAQKEAHRIIRGVEPPQMAEVPVGDLPPDGRHALKIALILFLHRLQEV